MKREIGTLAGWIASVAFVAFFAKPVVAACTPLSGESFRQQPPLASDSSQLLAEDGMLDRMRKRQEAKVASELTKNPKLLDDPKYLADHPKLADYLKKHPEAKPKIKQDPTGFFKQLEDERG